MTKPNNETTIRCPCCGFTTNWITWITMLWNDGFRRTMIEKMRQDKRQEESGDDRGRAQRR